jgi:hypothetical protein
MNELLKSVTDTPHDPADSRSDAGSPSLHPIALRRVTTADGRAVTPAERNAARQAGRRLVVYLDDSQRRWVRGVEADALRDNVRLSASAIVRLAIDELRTHAVGWRDLAGRRPESSDPAESLASD